MAPERKWTAEQLAAQDAVSKSDLVTFLQANASNKVRPRARRALNRGGG